MHNINLEEDKKKTEKSYVEQVTKLENNFRMIYLTKIYN